MGKERFSGGTPTSAACMGGSGTVEQGGGAAGVADELVKNDFQIVSSSPDIRFILPVMESHYYLRLRWRKRE